jgi:hypothetical protein
VGGEAHEFGISDLEVPNFAVPATLELIEIFESDWLEREVRTPADMTPVELEARSRRAALLVEHEQRREADKGSPEQLVFLVHGRTSIPVPSQWVENVMTLIDILRTEMGRGQAK